MVDNGYARETETIENTIERRVPMRFEKYWAESGRADEHGDVEKWA